MDELVKGSLNVLDVLRVRGGGLSEFYGPVVFWKFVWVGPLTADPSTTNWGTGEAGRMWFNVTAGKLKFWDGAAVRTITST